MPPRALHRAFDFEDGTIGHRVSWVPKPGTATWRSSARRGAHAHPGENEIDAAGGKRERQVLVGARRHELGARHDLGGPQNEGERGILQQDGILVGPAGQREAQRLGQHDATDRLHVGQAERACGAELAARQGKDGAAEDLRLVGAAGHSQHQGGGGERADVPVEELEQAEIEQEQQHQDRHAAEEPDIKPDEAAQRRGAIDLRHRHRQADGEAEPHAAQHRHDGQTRPTDEVGDRLEQNLDRLVHAGCRRFVTSSRAVFIPLGRKIKGAVCAAPSTASRSGSAQGLYFAFSSSHFGLALSIL